MKELFKVTIDAGIVNIDNLEAIQDTIFKELLNAAASFKLRNMNAAKLTLTLKATNGEKD